MSHNDRRVASIHATEKVAYQRMRRFLLADLYVSNVTELTIKLANGAVMWFKSGKYADSLYGEDVYAAVIDEASRLKAASWWAIRSTLTATEGPVRIIGNVNGSRNWAYKMARKAEAGAANMPYAKMTVWGAVEAAILPMEDALDARLNLQLHHVIWPEGERRRLER